MDSNVEDKIVFKQPKLFAERQAAVKILVERLKYRMPVAIDAMDNRADAAFAAWPERIYIVGAGGRIVYKGGMGPFEFDVKEAGERLGAARWPAARRPAASCSTARCRSARCNTAARCRTAPRFAARRRLISLLPHRRR